MNLVKKPFFALGFVGGVVILGAGVPLLWLWIASQMADTFLKIPLLPLFVMVTGLLVSYMAIASFVMRFDKERQAIGPPRMSWNRSLGAERHQGAKTTQWERIFIATTVIVAMAFEVWFFLFAGSSLPSPGN